MWEMFGFSEKPIDIGAKTIYSHDMLYKYIGMSPSDKIAPRNQFVVEVSQEEFDYIRKYPYPAYMRGTLAVAPQKLSGFCTTLGTTGSYVNPFYEQHTGNWPVWLRVDQ